MSAEKSHENKIDAKDAPSLMSYGQYEVSEDREVRVKFELQPILGSLFLNDVKTGLDSYNMALDGLESAKTDEYPPEWKADLEKARKIQSEIRQKFAELDGLFKLNG